MENTAIALSKAVSVQEMMSFIQSLRMSLREYNFTANNINQKPGIIKQRSNMFNLFHFKSKFSAPLSRSHYQSIKNLKTEVQNAKSCHGYIYTVKMVIKIN